MIPGETKNQKAVGILNKWKGEIVEHFPKVIKIYIILCDSALNYKKLSNFKLYQKS